jgi:hypothetical protein
MFSSTTPYQSRGLEPSTSTRRLASSPAPTSSRAPTWAHNSYEPWAGQPQRLPSRWDHPAHPHPSPTLRSNSSSTVPQLISSSTSAERISSLINIHRGAAVGDVSSPAATPRTATLAPPTAAAPGRTATRTPTARLAAVRSVRTGGPYRTTTSPAPRTTTVRAPIVPPPRTTVTAPDTPPPRTVTIAAPNTTTSRTTNTPPPRTTCLTCNKEFTCRGHLFNHQRSTVTANSPSRSPNSSKHVALATGVKPSICSKWMSANRIR